MADAQPSNRMSAYCAIHWVDATRGIIDGGDVTAASYMRVDGKVGYKLNTGSRGVTISVAGTNIFNDLHIEYPDTSTPIASVPQGRTLWVVVESGL